VIRRAPSRLRVTARVAARVAARCPNRQQQQAAAAAAAAAPCRTAAAAAPAARRPPLCRHPPARLAQPNTAEREREGEGEIERGTSEKLGLHLFRSEKNGDKEMRFEVELGEKG